jgi:hypothetical protein
MIDIATQDIARTNQNPKNRVAALRTATRFLGFYVLSKTYVAISNLKIAMQVLLLEPLQGLNLSTRKYKETFMN